MNYCWRLFAIGAKTLARITNLYQQGYNLNHRVARSFTEAHSG
jgi:hypothetical protein